MLCVLTRGMVQLCSDMGLADQRVRNFRAFICVMSKCLPECSGKSSLNRNSRRKQSNNANSYLRFFVHSGKEFIDNRSKLFCIRIAASMHSHRWLAGSERRLRASVRLCLASFGRNSIKHEPQRGTKSTSTVSPILFTVCRERGPVYELARRAFDAVVG